MKNTLKKLFVLAFIFLMLLSGALLWPHSNGTFRNSYYYAYTGANTQNPHSTPHKTKTTCRPGAEQLDGETYSQPISHSISSQ